MNRRRLLSGIAGALASQQYGFMVNPYLFGSGATGFPGTIAADSPLGYWRLGESSGTAAADSSGNGRHGSYVGSYALGATGLVTGDSDTGGTFSGGHVNVPYGSWMNTGIPFSTLCLINATTLGDLLTRRNAAADSTESVFIIRPNGMWLRDITGSPFDYSVIQNAAATSTRYMVLHSYDGAGVLRMYRNGLLIFAKSYQVTPAQPTAGDIRLMASKQNNTPTYYEQTQGVGDEFAFYGTALSAARAKALAQAAGFTVTDWTFDNAASTARAQWALRPVNGYSGNLIDVRRSSDNATTSIGSTGGDLDAATLLSWAGSASVYVTKWYDQSGNGHHAVQATSASQPRIVNAGTLETQNGKPILNFAAGARLEEQNSLVGTTDSLTAVHVGDGGFTLNRGQDLSGNGWSIQISASGAAVVFTSTSTSSYSGSGLGSGWRARAAIILNDTAGNSSQLAFVQDGYELNGVRTTPANSTYRTSGVGFLINGSAITSAASNAAKCGEVFVWRSCIDYGRINAVAESQKARYGIT